MLPPKMTEVIVTKNAIYYFLIFHSKFYLGFHYVIFHTVLMTLKTLLKHKEIRGLGTEHHIH